ncbi:MAG: hypothetical protein FWG92_03245 [Leptospirales bacterium]|nr:hypothetical protein [Leptospirales bacterium]
MRDDNIIFSITIDDLQNESMERIGRKLTDEEIPYAKKGVEWGLGDITLDMTYDTIFNEIIKELEENED